MKPVYFHSTGAKDRKLEQLKAVIYDWMNCREMKNLLECFGGKLPDDNNILTQASWLLEFSERWDYRKVQRTAQDLKTGEAARWLISSSSITKTKEEVIKKAAEKLGLVGCEVPMKRVYDYIVVLGGARLSCLLRPEYAVYVIGRFVEKPQSVFLLSGMRPVSDSEKSITDQYAPGAEMVLY